MLKNLSPSPKSEFAENAVDLLKAIVVPYVDLDDPPPCTNLEDVATVVPSSVIELEASVVELENLAT